MIELQGCPILSRAYTADGEFFVHLLLMCLNEIQSPYFDSPCPLSRLQVQVEPNSTNAELSTVNSPTLLG